MKARVPADLKEYNRMLVYRQIRSRGPVSRSEVATRLGLSVPTVLKIAEYFIGLGLVAEAGEGEAALGRKPKLLSLRPEAAWAVGAEYDGVHLSVGLVDLDGKIASSRRSPAPPDLGLLLGGLLAGEVESLLADSGVDRSLVKGLGLGVPGVVHQAERYISQAPLVGVGDRADYGQMIGGLEARLGMPVRVVNDANAAALGELSARRGEGGTDLIFVELGRGVGAGLVLDGRLREGPGFCAGEIGYMRLDGAGAARAGGGARAGANGRPAPGWLETAMDLPAFWAEVDASGAPGDAALRKASGPLALALANLCVALDVREVVIGRSGKEGFGPALLGLLRDELGRLCPFEVACEFSLAAEPGVAGAAGVASEAWLGQVCAG